MSCFALGPLRGASLKPKAFVKSVTLWLWAPVSGDLAEVLVLQKEKQEETKVDVKGVISLFLTTS